MRNVVAAFFWAATFVFATPARWAEPLKIRVGPDGNACGLMAPNPPAQRGIILWLHGGMRSENHEKGWEAWRALPPFLKPGSYYLCSPSAYAGADWLSPEGVAHIDALLDTVAKLYPVRMERFILVGVSDGCLGALRYAQAGKRKPARFILFSVFPNLAVDQNDLRSLPVFSKTRWDIFQGGRDRLFPSQLVFPALRDWSQGNPKVRLHLYPEGEHDFSWYIEHAGPEIRGLF
jgi:pimeloyl-ACP methyl ester carboxylesterase